MEKPASATEKTTRFAREVRTEFKKIVWPTWRQTGLFTASVIFMTGLVAGLVYVADALFQFGLGHL